jgi:hypothetical protein
MMAEHYCEMLLEDNTECGAPATRFMVTTFGDPDALFKRQFWLCNQHHREASELPMQYLIDGVPIVSEVLKEEF